MLLYLHHQKVQCICLQFMLSVTGIVHQPSGITLESSYIVIACVDSRSVAVYPSWQNVGVSAYCVLPQYAAEIPGFLTLPFATVTVAIIFRSYFVTCMQFVDSSDE